MRIAVCIVGFCNPQDIEECVHALAASTHRDFYLVICENGGREAHDELLRRDLGRLLCGQEVRILLAPSNLGYAGGVNACMRSSADADAWWILNPDTEPHPEALAELVAGLVDGPGQMVGGTILNSGNQVDSYGDRWRSWIGRCEAIGMGADALASVDQAAVERDMSYVSGCSLLVDRKFVEVAGLMREDYFLYAEEVEWALRGLQLGLKLRFAPGARVLHKHGTTTESGGDIRRRPKLPIYLDERNKVLVTRDRFPRRLALAAPAALALILLRYGRRGAWRQLGYAVQGWAAGVANRRGPPDWISVS